MTRKIFTLIEMLVVLAIISVLMAILLPALSKAKKMASGVSCVNNLKQLGLGISSYAGDYNEYLPSPNRDGWAGRNWVSVMYEARCVLAKTRQGILACPDAQGVLAGWSQLAGNGTTADYAMNFHLGELSPAAGNSANSGKLTAHKSDYIILAEANVGCTFAENCLERIMYRHPGGANLLFCDLGVRRHSILSPNDVVYGVDQ